MMIGAWVVAAVVVIAAIATGVVLVRHKTSGLASPTASSTLPAAGPGTVAWRDACIYTSNLATAQKDPMNVCSLDLFSQNLTEIPPAVFTMTNLEYLNLAGNNITDVPTDIGKLTRLKWLYLNQNPIASLPDSIGQLGSLQLLSAGFDKITSMPSSIAGMKNIQSIIVQGNPLPPPEVSRIKSTFAKASVIY